MWPSHIFFIDCDLVQIVLGPEAWSMGLGGVRAAGFWGNRWEYSPSTSYVNC